MTDPKTPVNENTIADKMQTTNSANGYPDIKINPRNLAAGKVLAVDIINSKNERNTIYFDLSDIESQQALQKILTNRIESKKSLALEEEGLISAETGSEAQKFLLQQ